MPYWPGASTHSVICFPASSGISRGLERCHSGSVSTFEASGPATIPPPARPRLARIFGDEDGFLAYARQLRTPTVFNAIRDAKRVGEIARFGFPASVWRHFEGFATFPRGLLPFGDAVCRFNPMYGQGMSVAAQEACLLHRLLGTRSPERDPLAELAPAFFAEAQALIDRPWAMAAVPDFVHPETRGQRPPDFEITIKFGLALTRLAARDPAVHKLIAEVQHFLKPRSVYRDPELVQRVLTVMAEA